MQWALRLCGVANVVVVHDAQAHPGDGFPLQMTLQRLLVRVGADHAARHGPPPGAGVVIVALGKAIDPAVKVVYLEEYDMALARVLDGLTTLDEISRVVDLTDRLG